MMKKEIPQEIVDLVDKRAGKKHSAEGSVMSTLAEVLDTYDQFKLRSDDLKSDVATRRARGWLAVGIVAALVACILGLVAPRPVMSLLDFVRLNACGCIVFAAARSAYWNGYRAGGAS